MKLHTAIAATLRELGVTTIFGVLGDGNMFFVDRYVDECGGRYLSTSNEAGAVLMASGFASASGEVGVATVTHGPGLANTMASLVSGTREHAPIVLLAGDTGRDARGHTQKINQSALVAPTGAGWEDVTSAARATEALVRAFRRAVSERRPIVYNVPVDLMFQDADAAVGATYRLRKSAVLPDPEAMDDAVGIIAAAKRPIVLAGAGALSLDARDALVRLAAVLGAPTATTIPAKGLFGRDEHDLGVFGSLSSPRAAEAISQCDCIIAVGASLNRLTGGGDGWPFFRDKRVVHCDIDVAALGREYVADASILADAAVFAGTVVEWLEQAEYQGSGFRDALGYEEDVVTDEPSASAGQVDLAFALAELDRILPAQRSLTVDGGRFTSEAVRRMNVLSSRSWSFSGRGFGAVGNGVATAIGVGCALRDAPSVAVVGDGGFMLGGLAEFNTAVRHGVDLIVIVCNDGSYGAEYRKLRSRDFSSEISMFEWPSFASVAASLGGIGVSVRSAEDLAEVAAVLEKRDRPVLIDLNLDPAIGSMDH
ncbi:MAG TPA: thiamine pyrophosphate-binding protein [Acidimicrobiales bacterium]|jgi:thiamine pyrophosphate-dependent acetolactate synthase large subunit-like protein|nr:thiamine pyrophosphate-binding protein [Acidimicrobiales bacterium]